MTEELSELEEFIWEIAKWPLAVFVVAVLSGIGWALGWLLGAW